MSTQISPKVTAGASVAAIVGLLLQYATTITPGTFAFLGDGQGLAFLIVTLALGALAAWWKTDPLRVVDEVSAPKHAAVAPVVLAPAVPVEVPAPVVPSVLLVTPTEAPEAVLAVPATSGAHVAP